MGCTKLVVFLLLAICLHAEVVASNDTTTNDATSSARINIDNELAKMSTSCIENREKERLTGNVVRIFLAMGESFRLLNNAQKIIGMEEMRSVVGLEPRGPWTNSTVKDRSKEEIASARTAEEYYDLNESRELYSTLTQSFFFMKMFPPAISFLDKQYPAIRQIYRQELEDALQGGKKIKTKTNKKDVDNIFEVYYSTSEKVQKAINDAVKNRCAGEEGFFFTKPIE